MERDAYLIIGGSGFLGRHIVEALLVRGDTVSVFDIVQRYHDVPFYSGDISDQAQVEEAIRKSGATCVIHTASPPHGLDASIYWKVNFEGTKAVIQAAVAHHVRKLVYTSSAGTVFNGQDLIGVDELLPFPDKPLDAYNESKAKAEELVLAANGKDGLLTVALRPAGIFGPGDKQVMKGFAEVFHKGQTHFQIGENTNLFDFTYVTNVVDAHLLAADKLSESHDGVERRKILMKTLTTVDLSTGDRRVPTSRARPLGPAVETVPDAAQIEKAFQGGHQLDDRPIVRSRFDLLSDIALDMAESDPLQVAGQAFFITNGEPVYFWDMPRAVWRELGAPDRSIFKMPKEIGLVLATLAEWAFWLVGKEPTFTRFRVTLSCTTKWHNIDKARRILGYEPKVGMVEGIKRMVEWYKAEQQSLQT